MATITLTRALARISVLKKKIGKSIGEARFVDATRGTGSQCRISKRNLSLTAATEEIERSYQSVTGLIEEKIRLQRQMCIANAQTLIHVTGFPPMTIAEALEIKRNLPFEHLLLQEMKNQLLAVESNIQRENEAMSAQIDKKIETVYSNDKSRVTADQYEAVAKPHREAKELAMFDPIKIRDKIRELEERIANFEHEIDFTLSEVNACTHIEV